VVELARFEHSGPWGRKLEPRLCCEALRRLRPLVLDRDQQWQHGSYKHLAQLCQEPTRPQSAHGSWWVEVRNKWPVSTTCGRNSRVARRRCGPILVQLVVVRMVVVVDRWALVAGAALGLDLAPGLCATQPSLPPNLGQSLVGRYDCHRHPCSLDVTIHVAVVCRLAQPSKRGVQATLAPNWLFTASPGDKVDAACVCHCSLPVCHKNYYCTLVEQEEIHSRRSAGCR
jgi:hypothetical protein